MSRKGSNLYAGRGYDHPFLVENIYHNIYMAISAKIYHTGTSYPVPYHLYRKMRRRRCGAPQTVRIYILKNRWFACLGCVSPPPSFLPSSLPSSVSLDLLKSWWHTLAQYFRPGAGLPPYTPFFLPPPRGNKRLTILFFCSNVFAASADDIALLTCSLAEHATPVQERCQVYTYCLDSDRRPSPWRHAGREQTSS